MNQRGFATLEVILMVMVIGILASIAVPRFTNVTTRANTAKIQADLTTIDTALAVYLMEKGDDKNPSVEDLASEGYLQGVPKPPTSSCYFDSGSGATITSTSTIAGSTLAYTIKDVTIGTGTSAVTVKRAVLGDENTAEKFYAP